MNGRVQEPYKGLRIVSKIEMTHTVTKHKSTHDVYDSERFPITFSKAIVCGTGFSTQKLSVFALFRIKFWTFSKKKSTRMLFGHH